MRPERWKLLALCLATFMLLLDITIVQAALPAIQRRLGGGLSGLQWTVDAYTLPLAALIISLGTVADRFGRRTIFLGGVAVFSAASLACGLSQSMAALDIWRAVQGAGGAAMFACLVEQALTDSAAGVICPALRIRRASPGPADPAASLPCRNLPASRDARGRRRRKRRDPAASRHCGPGTC